MSWDVVDLEQRLAATIPPRSKQLSLASSRHELHVLWHDGNSLGVDSAQIGVFE